MNRTSFSDTSKQIGKTASVGFQVGVRRTFPIPQEQAWEMLTSSEGLTLWLGNSPSVQLEASLGGRSAHPSAKNNRSVIEGTYPATL
ncbi:hypothetical protein [Brevibacillus sp. AY1]|uniref:ATPase n=1 Tax=Brevibacillus invocatus TaxID=173959 RepID=A0A3M8CF50_9BACL|nr:hypothetical protein [Brevibacillus sp. AY1]MDH4616504.1 hypothetical protein [Brevibacillus sp. AY1]RNB74340.1 hypothetical protein EDM52_11945 [Brevibacillus invocatus]